MLTLYRLATQAAGPFLPLLLRRRLAKGKEDAARLNERMGRPGRKRPDGKLLWAHAASIGESLSVLPLLKEMLARDASLHILVTTVTLSSAKLMAEKLPGLAGGERAIHQFAPLDHPAYVARFLEHWRPDAAIWVESELWPNMIRQTHARAVPMALVNGRIGNDSYANWQRWRGTIRELLGCFSDIYAQSEEDARRFRNLGARRVTYLGNLKYDSPPLPADAKATGALLQMIGGRHLWLAASTHPGEEAMIGRIHKALEEEHPDLLTIIVPRHERRGDELARALRAQGLQLAQRSKDEPITGQTEIYLADTTGELGIFYRLAGVVLIGGTLVPHGGQNPLEPARLDCALLAGPHTQNFREVCDRLEQSAALIRIADTEVLQQQVDRLLADTGLQEALASSAMLAVKEEAGVTARMADALQDLFR